MRAEALAVSLPYGWREKQTENGRRMREDKKNFHARGHQNARRKADLKIRDKKKWRLILSETFALLTVEKYESEDWPFHILP